MQKRDIDDGETYLFIGTTSAEREHLVGRPFTVSYRKAVFRKAGGRTGKRIRFFNHDGVGARAEELEPLPDEYAGFDEMDPVEQEKLVEMFRAPLSRNNVVGKLDPTAGRRPKRPGFTGDDDQDDPF